jgi:hypothetical protein
MSRLPKGTKVKPFQKTRMKPLDQSWHWEKAQEHGNDYLFVVEYDNAVAAYVLAYDEDREFGDYFNSEDFVVYDDIVPVGTKVVPFQKSVGNRDLHMSAEWRRAQSSGQPFMYVVRNDVLTDDGEVRYSLGEKNLPALGGDFFTRGDFTIYEEPNVAVPTEDFKAGQIVQFKDRRKENGHVFGEVEVVGDTIVGVDFNGKYTVVTKGEIESVFPVGTKVVPVSKTTDEFYCANEPNDDPNWIKATKQGRPFLYVTGHRREYGYLILDYDKGTNTGNFYQQSDLELSSFDPSRLVHIEEPIDIETKDGFRDTFYSSTTTLKEDLTIDYLQQDNERLRKENEKLKDVIERLMVE